MNENAKSIISKIQAEKEGFVNSPDGIRSIGYFTNLNSDTAHFVWELIQNAEDVHATEVTFHLYKSSLHVRHNGTPFTPSNVESICSILYSDKTEGQIGKFGAGFKTVFAYTDAPEIYSGDFSFKITKLVYPEVIPERENLGDDTLFVLPFMYSKRAYEEIADKLNLLSTQALMFLQNIQRLRIIVNGSERIVERKSTEHVDIDKYSFFEEIEISDNFSSKKYYRFALNGLVLTDIDKYGHGVTINNQSVMIAYRLDSYDKIIPISKSKDIDKYFVFFPTEIKTDLEFLVHAPFKTTINRETIVGNSEANKKLYQSIMMLVVKSLLYLVERGVVTTDFYNQILFPGGAFIRSSHLYDLLKESVTKVLQNDIPVLPTEEGTYARMSEILIETYKAIDNKGVIKKHFSVAEIGKNIAAYRHCKYWDHGYYNTNIHRLIQSAKKVHDVGQMELGLSELVANLDYYWLSEKTISQLKGIYTIFVSKDYSLTYFASNIGNLNWKVLPLIRTPDGKQVKAGSVYWREGDIHPDLMKDDYCKYFICNSLGVEIYNESSEIKDTILRKYLSNNKDELNLETSIQDLHVISEALSKGQLTIQEIRDYPLFLGVNAANPEKTVWSKASELYLRQKTGGLKETEILLGGITNVYFIHDSYNEFSNLLLDMGIQTEVRIRISPDQITCSGFINHQIQLDNDVSRKSIYIFPEDPFKPNVSMDHLKEILNTITLEKSLALFHSLFGKENFVKGRLSWNTSRSNSLNSTSQHGSGEFFSEIGWLLYTIPWIYGKDNRKYLPTQLSTSSVLPDYLENLGILELLEVRGAKVKRNSDYIKENNADASDTLCDIVDELDTLNEDELDEVRVAVSRKKTTKSIFDMLSSMSTDNEVEYSSDDDDGISPSPINDLKKRGDSLTNELKEEILKTKRGEYDVENQESDFEDSISSNDDVLGPENGKKSKLKSSPRQNKKSVQYVCSDTTKEERMFLQQEYDGYCQICGDRIRKAVRRGSSKFPYYFEARNIIKTHMLDEIYRTTQVVDGWNSLSLCPMCAAKYLYCSKDLSTFAEQVLAAKIKEKERKCFEIHIMLDGKNVSIHYTPKHLLALQKALQFFKEYET